MTERRRPWLAPHLGLMLGVSAGTYGLLLAWVAANQSAADRAAIAQRAPIERGIDHVRSIHDQLDSMLAANGDRYAAAAAAYAGLQPNIAGLEAQIARLADVVGAINGQAASLPARAPMPSVQRHVAAAPPTVHATTGASGGG